MKVKSLFISDCHLGNDFCNHQELLDLLKNIEADNIFIIGDFFDGWSLKRKFKWHNNYNTIIQKLLRMSRKGSEIYIIYGNHDDFLESFNEYSFGNIHIKRSHIYSSINNGDLLLIHGDQFDGLISKHKFLVKLGSVIYDYSIALNYSLRFLKFSFSQIGRAHV